MSEQQWSSYFNCFMMPHCCNMLLKMTKSYLLCKNQHTIAKYSSHAVSAWKSFLKLHVGNKKCTIPAKIYKSWYNTHSMEHAMTYQLASMSKSFSNLRTSNDVAWWMHDSYSKKKTHSMALALQPISLRARLNHFQVSLHAMTNDNTCIYMACSNLVVGMRQLCGHNCLIHTGRWLINFKHNKYV